MNFQSDYAPRERARLSARRLENSVWAANGISVRRELAGFAVAMVLLALCALGVAVVF